MKSQSNKKKLLPIILPVALILIACAVFGALYLPGETAYRNARKAGGTLPYTEAYDTMKNAIHALDKPLFAEKQSEIAVLFGELVSGEAKTHGGSVPYDEVCGILSDVASKLSKPQFSDRQKTLIRLEEELRDAEIRSAIAAEETDRALALIDTLPQEEAEPYRRLLYDVAEKRNADGRLADAASLFAALGSFSDAAERADEIRETIRLQDITAGFSGNNYDETIAALFDLHTAEGDAAANALIAERAERIVSTFTQAQGMISAGAWHTAAVGTTPWIAGDARYADAPKQAEKVFSGLASVFYLSDGKVLTTGETFGAEETIASLTDVVKAAPGLIHGLFLHADGHVTAVGSKALDRLPKEDWTGVTDIAAGAWHSVALRKDGTVVACGTDDRGQCAVTEWTDITAVSAGLWHTVGLKKDGTVVACGDNAFGQCQVEDWSDVIAVSCGACTTVGLKKDGTVVACGDNAAGQCLVSDWTDVAAIAAGAYHTVALRMDGSVVSAGLTPADLPENPLFASDWIVKPIDAPKETEKTVTAYVCGVGEDYGPWLYLDDKGAAVVCIDYSGERELLRGDMLATKNAMPGGRVTEPENTSAYNQMHSVLAEKQARQHHAVLAFTGDFIGWTSNRKGIMIRNGVVYYDRPETYVTTLAVMPDGTLKCYQPGQTDAAKLQALGVRDSFSFGPLLVEDKKVAYVDDGKDLSTGRVGFGYSDPYHYIVIVALRERHTALSWVRLSNIFVSFGARVAYNLDGGHSSSLVFMGYELSTVPTRSHGRFTNIRGLSDIVMFLENPSVQPRE